METFLSRLGQAIAGSALTNTTFIGVRFTKLGERFLDHRLNAKIAAIGHANTKEIEGTPHLNLRIFKTAAVGQTKWNSMLSLKFGMLTSTPG